jgi:hypothetical protein
MAVKVHRNFENRCAPLRSALAANGRLSSSVWAFNEPGSPRTSNLTVPRRSGRSSICFIFGSKVSSHAQVGQAHIGAGQRLVLACLMRKPYARPPMSLGSLLLVLWVRGGRKPSLGSPWLVHASSRCREGLGRQLPDLLQHAGGFRGGRVDAHKSSASSDRGG